MKKQDLIDGRKQMAKFHHVWTMWSIVAVCLLYNAASWLTDHVSESSSAFWIIFVTFVPILTIILIVAVWVSRFNRTVAKYGLQCPSCGVRIDGNLGQVAVAAGICGDCGQRIIND